MWARRPNDARADGLYIPLWAVLLLIAILVLAAVFALRWYRHAPVRPTPPIVQGFVMPRPAFGK
jgi:hypothetical protein